MKMWYSRFDARSKFIVILSCRSCQDHSLSHTICIVYSIMYYVLSFIWTLPRRNMNRADETWTLIWVMMDTVDLLELHLPVHLLLLVSLTTIAAWAPVLENPVHIVARQATIPNPQPTLMLLETTASPMAPLLILPWLAPMQDLVSPESMVLAMLLPP